MRRCLEVCSSMLVLALGCGGPKVKTDQKTSADAHTESMSATTTSTSTDVNSATSATGSATSTSIDTGTGSTSGVQTSTVTSTSVHTDDPGDGPRGGLQVLVLSDRYGPTPWAIRLADVSEDGTLEHGVTLDTQGPRGTFVPLASLWNGNELTEQFGWYVEGYLDQSGPAVIAHWQKKGNAFKRYELARQDRTKVATSPLLRAMRLANGDLVAAWNDAARAKLVFAVFRDDEWLSTDVADSTDGPVQLGEIDGVPTIVTERHTATGFDMFHRQADGSWRTSTVDLQRGGRVLDVQLLQTGALRLLMGVGTAPALISFDELLWTDGVVSTAQSWNVAGAFAGYVKAVTHFSDGGLSYTLLVSESATVEGRVWFASLREGGALESRVSDIDPLFDSAFDSFSDCRAHGTTQYVCADFFDPEIVVFQADGDPRRITVAVPVPAADKIHVAGATRP